MKRINTTPTARVSVKKSVLKKYKVENENVYFLDKNAEFEIELFNPLQETILCRFSLNGKSMSSDGLVLNPGERVFLERHLDTNEKLLFNTYEVEDSKEVKYAIEKNGLVRVTFHKEAQNYNYISNGWDNDCVAPWNLPDVTNPGIFYYDATSASMSFEQGSDITFTTSQDNFVTLDTLETGRIDKGSNSGQSFTYVNKDFNSISFASEEFKLLPVSVKVKTSKDLKIRTYCTQCGKKAKVKNKFCSACGTKI